MARRGLRREDGQDLRRRGPTRDPLPLILVVCEGKVTEPEYVDAFRIAQGANTVRVRVESPGGDPKALWNAQSRSGTRPIGKRAVLET